MSTGQHRIRGLFLLTACAVAAPGLSQAWGEEPEVVARVNGEAVTREEVRRVLADPAMGLRLQQELGVEKPDKKELERSALRKLINRRLILQEADRRNFTVTEQELNQAVTKFRRHFKNARRYTEWMKARGLDEESLRESLRANLLITRVRAALEKDVRVSEEEIQAYYAAHQADLQTAEQVRLRTFAVRDKAAAEEILAALKNGETFERLARERSLEPRAAQGGDMGWVSTQTLGPPLREAIGTLKVGETFERLARERSLEPRAAQGGDMGWVSTQTLGPPLREAIGTLKVGETSGPLERDGQFLVVRLEERRPARTRSLAEVRSEVERLALAAKKQEVFRAWFTEQERQSTIEVLLQPESSARTHLAISTQSFDFTRGHEPVEDP